MTVNAKILALAQHLSCPYEEAEKMYDTKSGDDPDFFVLTDGEASSEVREYILEDLWSFLPEFLSGMTGIDRKVFETLASLCEGANDAIRSLIEGSCGLDKFVEAAVNADGRGHFLAPYDGVERESTLDGVRYFIYRRG